LGRFNASTVDRAGQQSLRLVLWTVDSSDWKGLSADRISARVVDRVKDGSIVLMHDGGGDRSQTVKALRTILRDLSARGFKMRALSECATKP
jgi:peptidoglycan/xylan/chitin deacetylase (PgdA/CDA1 family)